MLALLAVLAAAGAVFWFLTGADGLDARALAAIEPGDAARGERVFWAGGCSSCHARPDAQGDAKLELAGGLALATGFGTFVAPNISPDPNDGIGAWSEEDFANAMLRGVSPEGAHYYPAFPYTSYARMAPQDVADLFAFIKTLPPVSGEAGGHQLSFPFNVRRGLGLWKMLYLDDEPVLAIGEDAPQEVRRGQYLVEGPGHCGECHTPRSFTGALKKAEWLAGAPAAEGDGIVPNITPGEGGIGSWSASDIAYYLESGFTPDFDSVGGAMAAVQANMAKLPAEDREAIAAYLKSVPPRPNGYPASR
ncbi:Fructose dehydrogenase cytochrome subunit [Nitratireductor thuwali]|uniref:Fructose dehydrogenase cytochrome subunit n=2 Tax=Nitratireductor thuwali TaxID=2267699 RepID=A0ABY5MSR0_9HYPH|nr:Fructose dehydrogenase cytochrome subunit [Nitratireductor thuwali]